MKRKTFKIIISVARRIRMPAKRISALAKFMLTLALAISLVALYAPAGAAAAAGGIDYSSGKGYTLTLPASWAGKYRVSEFSVAEEFINVGNEKAGCGGFLFSIMVQDNLEPLEWNGFTLLGKSGGLYYFLGLPSDVQFDYNDKALADEYQAMEKDIKSIVKTLRFRAADSPERLKILLDGREVVPDVAPFVDSNGRTMAPVRFISEALDAKVYWSPSAQTVTIRRDTTVISLAIGSAQITVDGKTTAMDTAAVVKDGRTFVPVRYIAEALRLSVDWDGEANAVILTSAAQREANKNKFGLQSGCWETSDRGEPRRDIKLDGKTVSIRSDWIALEFYPEEGDTFYFWECSFEGGNWKMLCQEGYADYDGEFLYLYTVCEFIYKNSDFNKLTEPVSTVVYPVVQPTVYKVVEWTDETLEINEWDEILYNFAGKGDRPPRAR